jgi:hypothetical protein
VTPLALLLSELGSSLTSAPASPPLGPRLVEICPLERTEPASGRSLTGACWPAQRRWAAHEGGGGVCPRPRSDRPHSLLRHAFLAGSADSRLMAAIRYSPAQSRRCRFEHDMGELALSG